MFDTAALADIEDLLDATCQDQIPDDHFESGQDFLPPVDFEEALLIKGASGETDEYGEGEEGLFLNVMKTVDLIEAISPSPATDVNDILGSLELFGDAA